MNFFIIVNALVFFILQGTCDINIKIIDDKSPELDDLEITETRRIVGGNYAKPGQFPFLASLQMNGSHFCGGSIIGKRWVLSAAHCFEKAKMYINKAFVVIGTTSLLKEGFRRTINGLIPHKKHDEETFTNDICLIRVYPDIVYDQNIQPIPISSTPPQLGSWVTVIGFGDTSYKGKLSSRLKYTFLQVIPNWKCKKMFHNYVSDTLMCALAMPGDGTCNGDSGGPLILDGYLVGLSAWGMYCAAGYPDTFTNVHFYTDWIQQNTAYYDNLPTNF